MANGNGKPKLELPVNQPVKIKLLQDKGVIGQSSYGPWCLFNVESNGSEFSFFVPEPIQKFIGDNQLGRNDELQITKSITNNGKSFDFKIELITKAPVPPAPVSNGSPKADDYQIMRLAMQQAIELQKELGSVIDVNRVGISLYISRSKNGNGYS
jgi:hypothetical protein